MCNYLDALAYSRDQRAGRDSGRKRDRSFVYQAYLERLRIGTELDSRPG